MVVGADSSISSATVVLDLLPEPTRSGLIVWVASQVHHSLGFPGLVANQLSPMQKHIILYSVIQGNRKTNRFVCTSTLLFNDVLIDCSRMEHKANMLWIPPNSSYNTNQEWLNKNFKKTRRNEFMMIKSENVLTPKSLQKVRVIAATLLML